MDSADDDHAASPADAFGERWRTWKMFLATVRWLAIAAGLLLFLLLALRMHNGSP